jgi:phospholipid/cholesterol/gamma-HCH transport system substrate-binding protein
VSKLSTELAGVSGKLDGTLRAAENLLQSVDREKVETIVANVEEFTANLKKSGEQLDGVMRNVDTAVKSVNEFAQSANQTVTKVDSLLESVDPETVRTALADIGDAGKGARRVVEDVSKVTAKFGERADDIDQIIVDAREISGRLNRASARIDGVLAKVDSLFGSGEAEGVMAEASTTLREFRRVAETLNAWLGTITEGLARFSGQGLRNVEALVGETRRAVGRIEEAASSLERNPQRLLSGGEGTVRQYGGRARR